MAALHELFGPLAFLLLVFAPGAWVTFGLPLGAFPFWARLFTGAMLSPLVVCAEFFALRLLGLPFGAASIALVGVNAPALWLVWRRRPAAMPAARDWAVAAVVAAICVASMAEVLIYKDARVYSPHAWIYADPVYMLARGDLVLDDPSLAGVRLAYPVWSALVFQAVASFLLNSPPISDYVWGNLLWLAMIYAFAMGVARELGGGRLARIAAGIFLLAGTNPVGYLLRATTPARWSHYRLWGDLRYTPWVSKFDLFSTMPLGLGMLMAMIYLVVRRGPLTRQLLATLCLLASGIGLLYPLLLPPAAGLLGAACVGEAVRARREGRGIPYGQWASLAAVLLVAVLATYAEVRFLTHDRRETTAVVQFSTPDSAVRKVFVGVLATSLLLAGMALVARRTWRSTPAATVFLASGALACYFLHAVFYIPYWDNEYKFIFAAAMFLAAFPGLAVERIWREWPRARAVPALACVAVVVLAGYSLRTWRDWHHTRNLDAALVDTSRFDLGLDARDAWSRICGAARRMTPPDSVLLVDSTAFYFPELTARDLYVQAANAGYPGVTLWADDLVADIRGNGHAIVDRRRADLLALFGSEDPGRRSEALERMFALQRPLALILEPRHGALLRWLATSGVGAPVWRGGGFTLWLIPRPAPGAVAQLR